MGTFSVRKTTEQFIAEAKAIHGNKYDYSKVEYKGNKVKVCIICPIHGEFWQVPKSHLRSIGCNKCYQCSKHKYGVAIYDIPDSCLTECYVTWRCMLERTVGTSYKKKYHTYSQCTICDEWLTFSNFKRWFDNPDNGYMDGYHLDKDLISKGNKLYSPQTCCFLPAEINIAIVKRKKGKSKVTGVGIKGNLFESTVSKRGKKVYLGLYKTIEQAFETYKYAKESYIKELAEKYFQEGKITKKVYDALMKYEIEITD